MVLYINNKKIKLISVLLLVMGIIFPVGFLLGFITAKVAFPIMFTCIGCQQLLNGLTFSWKNKYLKLLSISFGVFFIIFAIFIVLPFYFN